MDAIVHESRKARRDPLPVDAAIELDHVAGRANSEAVTPLQRDAHRDVTDLRLAMGGAQVPAAGDSPLLRLAHLLLGWASYLVLAARWLAELDRHLVERLGPGWAADAPVLPFA